MEGRGRRVDEENGRKKARNQMAEWQSASNQTFTVLGFYRGRGCCFFFFFWRVTFVQLPI